MQPSKSYILTVSIFLQFNSLSSIRRALAAENPRTYLPNVAETLLNLSIFYLQAQPDAERSIALATEVLEIAQDFQQVPVVMQYAATAVQVLQANGVELSQSTPEP